jgi:hypothetical protein
MKSLLIGLGAMVTPILLIGVGIVVFGGKVFFLSLVVIWLLGAAYLLGEAIRDDWRCRK